MERCLGRDRGFASLHRYDGQTAGRSQRAAHPAEVARRLRQWRRCWGQRGCADRYHHYFQLLDSNTNSNPGNANSNSRYANSHANADNTYPDSSHSDSNPNSGYTNPDPNSGYAHSHSNAANAYSDADTGSTGRQSLDSSARSDR